MPVVTLKMGSSLNPDDIKEGDGVYFECTIRSNPKPYKMAWYHDVSIKKFYHLNGKLIFVLFVCFIYNNFF